MAHLHDLVWVPSRQHVIEECFVSISQGVVGELIRGSSSVSSVLPDGMVIAIAVPCLVSVLDPPRVEASQQAVVHMADPASVIVDGGTISAPVASMYQTDSVSLRMKIAGDLRSARERRRRLDAECDVVRR
jgi:hypothetical protein